MKKVEKSKVEIKKPPILFDQTQKVVAKISRQLKGDFLTYWTSVNSRIVDEDVIAFFEILRSRKNRGQLYFFIKSGGGSGEGSLRIVNLIRKYYNKITAFVPLDCASAATMLVLGADSIQMGPLGYLSAIDTSIKHDLSPVDKFNDLTSVSQIELSRVIKLWEQKKQKNDLNPYGDLYKYIHPLVFGSVDRASSLSIKITTDILSYHLKDKGKAQKISNHLNSEYPSHSYPITFAEAKKIGLKVAALDNDINDDLLRLNELYSEMAQLAYTDYDQLNYHDNEILKFVETPGIQIFYQKDKDWHYRTEEKRWVPMNDESSWRKNEIVKGKTVTKNFHIR
jgi:ClpP class serine protease